jgi:hypothetical protein
VGCCRGDCGVGCCRGVCEIVFFGRNL